MKKKIVVLVAALALSLMALAGCGGGSDNPYVGTWEAVSISAFGQEMTAEEAEMEWTLEIKDGGEAVITADGEEETCSWEEADDGITLKFDIDEEDMSYFDPEEMAMSATIEDDELVLNFFDMMDIHMEKK